jgi:hypothetical protein
VTVGNVEMESTSTKVWGEAERQRALDELDIVDTPPEERFDRVTRLAQRLFGVPMAAVSLIDHDRQWFKSRQGIDLTETARQNAFCDVAIGQGELLIIEDTHSDERFRRHPLVEGDPRIRFYAGQPLHAPGGEPVGTICLFDRTPRTLSPDERKLLSDLALWVQQELTVREELDRAAQVQRSLLPRRTPVVQGYDLAAMCLPSAQVGGDFFDWYESHRYDPEPGLGFVLADVMGKGIAAAIMMATVRAGLRASARQPTVSAAVEQAAAGLAFDLEETSTLVTLFGGRLDTATGAVHYVDAGHGLALVVRRDGSVERPAVGGLPLGIHQVETWKEGLLVLEPGDSFVVFSDGVLDLYDGSLRALDEVVSVVRDAPTARAVADQVATRTRRSRPPDDVTVICLRRLDD